MHSNATQNGEISLCCCSGGLIELVETISIMPTTILGGNGLDWDHITDFLLVLYIVAYLYKTDL